MDESDLKYFSEFLQDFQKESDRGGALVGAALLDTRLERLLLSHMVEGKVTNELVIGRNAPLGTFSSRINACFALGLITTLERHDLNLVRNIRNEFAHREHGLTFEDEKIKGLCSSLNPRHPPAVIRDQGYPPRQRYNDGVIFTAMQLWYRPEHATGFKAQQRAWPY
jgi:mannitol operon repressor